MQWRCPQWNAAAACAAARADRLCRSAHKTEHVSPSAWFSPRNLASGYPARVWPARRSPWPTGKRARSRLRGFQKSRVTQNAEEPSPIEASTYQQRNPPGIRHTRTTGANAPNTAHGSCRGPGGPDEFLISPDQEKNNKHRSGSSCKRTARSP